MNAPAHERTVQQVLISNYGRAGDEDFLTLIEAGNETTSHTYRALLNHASAWTNIYQSRGLMPGDRVVIILRHSLDLYAAYIGAMLGGLVPAMFAHPSPKLSMELYFRNVDRLLENSQARLLVCYPELQNVFQDLTAALPDIGGVLTPDEVVFDCRDTASLGVESGAGPDPDDTAFLQYSSGTTGLKKGVAISHRALLWQVRQYARTIAADQRDTIVSWLPLYHDMGLIACFFLPLILRIPLVAMSPFDWVQRPTMWAEAVDRFGATLSWLPNFAYNFIAKNLPEDADYDLSSLRGVVNCSEPIMAESHELFLDKTGPLGMKPAALAASYAMAENTFAVTSGGFGVTLTEHLIDREALECGNVVIPTATCRTRRVVSSGRPLPETEITIRDETGHIIGETLIGEIAIGAPCLFREYDQNPEATAASLRDGTFYTGDMGYFNDGELYVVGRKSDIIIIGGRNLYPEDLEALANDVPGVIPGRAVALGVDDVYSGTQRLVMLTETHETGAAAEALIERIRASLAKASETTPADIRLLPHQWLSKSTSGKIARAENRERYLALVEAARRTSPTSSVAARLDSQDGLDARLRRAVEQELRDTGRLPGDGLADDHPLVSSGLIDSFGLVNLIAAIEATAGITLPNAVTQDIKNIDSVTMLANTVRQLRDGAKFSTPQDQPPARASEVAVTLKNYSGGPRYKAGFWTWYYQLLFRHRGIRFGNGLRVLGPLMLRINGDARNIIIGNNVTLMPGVDLKNREQGSIVIGHGVGLDTNVRLVAANDALLRLGDRAQLGMGTIINAGTDVIIGRESMTASNCNITASDHKTAAGASIMNQGFIHSPIFVGADVWIAANCMITRGSRIGDGAVIGANSVVSGDIPAGAVASGNPARVLKSRV